MLIALTVVFVGVVEIYLAELAPGPREIAVESIVMAWGENEESYKIEVSFEHIGGQTVRLEDLAVIVSGTDFAGVHRNYRSDELSAGMVSVDMVICHENGDPDYTRTRFELGDVLKATFMLESRSYLLDISRDVTVSLIYKPADQVLAK